MMVLRSDGKSIFHRSPVLLDSHQRHSSSVLLLSADDGTAYINIQVVRVAAGSGFLSGCGSFFGI